MTVGTYVEKYRIWKIRSFQWRDELSLTKKLALALGMACVTGPAGPGQDSWASARAHHRSEPRSSGPSGGHARPWFGALSMLLYLAIGGLRRSLVPG